MGLVPHPQLLVLLVQEPPVARRLADLVRELRQRLDPLVPVDAEEERERVPVHSLPRHPVRVDIASIEQCMSQYLYDVADVDDDAAVDGLCLDPVSVLEDLEAPDAVL
ncbi:hypothetical protein EJB05_54123, partial [Eragrostis curvula]